MNKGTMILNIIIDNYLKNVATGVVEKHINNSEVVKCANTLKELVKDISDLKSDEESAAAILLAKKMVEEESKNN